MIKNQLIALVVLILGLNLGSSNETLALELQQNTQLQDEESAQQHIFSHNFVESSFRREFLAQLLKKVGFVLGDAGEDEMKDAFDYSAYDEFFDSVKTEITKETEWNFYYEKVDKEVKNLVFGILDVAFTLKTSTTSIPWILTSGT